MEQKISFNIGFIGIGQGGCKIASSFYEIGYPAIFLNTAEIDLEALDVDTDLKLVIGETADGAGKRPEVSMSAVEHSKEDILGLIRENMDDCDRIIVCAGAGGGTGSGGCFPVVDLAKEVLGEEGQDRNRVGVIITSPRRLECASGVVKKNAKDLLVKACKMCALGEIAPMMILNNRRIKNVVPNATMRNMWEKSNEHVSSLIHEFNTITQVPSEFECMDKADLETVLLSPGCVSFGASSFMKDSSPQQMKGTMMSLFTNTMFSHSESDMSQQSYGIILKVPSKVFDEDEGFFERFEQGLELVIKSVRGGYIHKGIYEDEEINHPIVYCISRGIKGPEKRVIQEL